MFKKVIHKMDEGFDALDVITHGKQDCECSPRKAVDYKNVGKPSATIIVTFIHKG